MSFFNQNRPFEDGFLERGVPRPTDMRNMPMRGPVDQDVNSRRFDPRQFQEHRDVPHNNPHGNPQFRPPLDPRMAPHPGRGLEKGPPMDRPFDRGLDRPFDNRGMDRPSLDRVLDHPSAGFDIQRGLMDPRHHAQHSLESRGNELRTYDRQPPVNSNPPNQNRIDPRINFSVGLPPSMHQQHHHQQQQQQPLLGASHQQPSVPSHHPHHQPAQLSQQHQSNQQHPPTHPHAPGSQMNNPFGPSLFAPFNRPTVTEIVPVHVDLATFAAEPKFQQILLKVKEQSAVNFISLNRIADDVVESIVIEAPTKDAALLARNLIETHLKLQMKIKAAENRLQRVQTDLFSTQGEIAAGQMIEFSIQPELIGLAIGKKGSRIKQIETETGVSSINVNDNGHIMIYGPDSQSVQRAREQLELLEESFPLLPAQLDWMSDKMNAAVVADLKSGSGVMVAKVNRDTVKLDVVGTGSAVQTAKFLLSTQLEYIDKQIEIETNEREAREKLNAVRKQYGLNNPQWKNKNQKGSGQGRSISPTEDRGKRSGDHSGRPTGTSSAKNSEAALDSLVRAAMTGPGSRNVKTSEKEVNAGHKKDHTVEVDELDALISYPDEPHSRKQSEQQQRSSKHLMPKELVMADSFLGTPLEQDRSKGDGKAQNKDKDNKGKQGNKKSQDKSEGKQSEKGNKGNDKQDKQREKREKQQQSKANDRDADSSDGGLVVIPPAPLLTVPPPPASNTGKDSKNAEKGQRKKGKKNEGKDQADSVQEEKKVAKESMLVKINNPFLEQKGKKSSEELIADVTSRPATTPSSRIVSIIAETPGAVENQNQGNKKPEHDKSNRRNKTDRMENRDADNTKGEGHGENLKKTEGNEDKRGKKKGKNQDKAANDSADKPADESPVVATAADLLEFSRLNILGDFDKTPMDSIQHLEIPPPRKVKKGPPAIQNKILDDDLIVVEEPKVHKPAELSIPHSLPEPTSSENPPTPAKKSSPHLPPPPGLAASSVPHVEPPSAHAAPPAAPVTSPSAPPAKEVKEAPKASLEAGQDA